jgi:ParB-like chromosome segregation protein Spo0J
MRKNTPNLTILARLNKQMPQITPAAPEKTLVASALDDGIDLGELGILRWVDVSDTEESPWQTRDGYDDEHIQTLEDSLNGQGLIEVPPARLKPGAEHIVQIAAGHCRTEAVRRGANAGSNLPDPERFQGKMLFWIRPLSDLAMAAIAVEENEARENPNWIERAKGYVNLKAELKKAGLADETATWEFVATKAKISKRRVLQIVALLKLPESAKKKIAEGIWNEKHGRAILETEPENREVLMGQIERKGLSGNDAGKAAANLRKTHPTQRDLDLGVAVDGAVKKAKKTRGKVAAQQNQASPTGGGSPFRLIPGGAAAPTLDPKTESQKMAAELAAGAPQVVMLTAEEMVDRIERFAHALPSAALELSKVGDMEPELKSRLSAALGRISTSAGEFYDALHVERALDEVSSN